MYEYSDTRSELKLCQTYLVLLEAPRGHGLLLRVLLPGRRRRRAPAGHFLYCLEP